MPDLRYDLTDQPVSAMLEGVQSLLRQYNRSKNAASFEARDRPENAPRPLHVYALEETGALAGGLIGETAFSWLKVEMLAVSADHRGRGVGTRLLQEAEREALSRGCRYAWLDTMSYQAPDFYAKVGYQIAGRFEDWDSYGHTKFFFTRKLR
jgi:ribosomal protein S18 acetylase RimI-like enzyme